MEDKDALRQILAIIRARLETGPLPDEQAISQTIVLPVLKGLGWDCEDSEIVSPDCGVAPKRVGYAVCHPPGRPAAFIEAKQTGEPEEVEWQLCEHAFREGVPMAIFTDGRTWSFHLPSDQDSLDDCCFYRLHLMERSVEEAAVKLLRYLARSRIASGAALEDARADEKLKRLDAKVGALVLAGISWFFVVLVGYAKARPELYNEPLGGLIPLFVFGFFGAMQAAVCFGVALAIFNIDSLEPPGHVPRFLLAGAIAVCLGVAAIYCGLKFMELNNQAPYMG